MTDPNLYVEVQAFYAHQMPLLEARNVEEFVLTFTEDGVYQHAKDGWRFVGRAQLSRDIRASLPHYGDKIFRHWFDRMVIRPGDDGALNVSYHALVSITDEAGQVVFEPSSIVHDVLVRVDGVLHTKSRTVRHDIPDPQGFWAERLAS